MPKKIPPPSPPFIAARWHGGAQTPSKRIVIHGTVSACKPGGARSVANFFAHEGNKTSAHYVVDPAEVIQCVGDHTVAYHAPPNQDTIGVEQCDMVAGPASRWDDKNHTAMLERTAKLVAQLGLAYGVPLVRVNAGQLKAGKHGICGHVDVSNAWHQTTHTDPGDGFPWDRFMGLVAKAAADLLDDPPPAAEHHLAIDYSWARPDPKAIKAAGYRGVFRYLSRDTTGKNLTDAERQALHAAGLWVGMVWEDGKTRAREGAAAGLRDVKSAEALADKLGIPKHAAILYAVDFDAQPAEVKPYLDAVKTLATRPFGVYGGLDVIDAGFGDYGWQTQAWSEGHVSPKANMLQLAGDHTHTIEGSKATDWDEDRVLHGAIPVWLPGQAKWKPPPPPPPVPDSPTWVVTQANVQQTDSLKDILSRIHAVADGTSAGAVPPDVVVWNEIGGKHQAQLHDAIHALPGFASYTVEGVGISWRTSVFHDVGRGGRVVNRGVAHLTPDRPLIYVDLQHLAAQKMYRQEAGHSVHHVDVGGLPRIKGALLGQNRRARRYFAAIAADLKAAKVASLPCVFEGDLNVDLLAEKHLPPSKRCQWFPLTVLGAMARIRMPLHGTHGGRAIDWNVVAGAVYVLDNEVLPHGTSDHNPVQHTLTFDRSLTGVEPSL